jgi:hypothetical protein
MEAQVLNTFYSNPEAEWDSSRLSQITHMVAIFEKQIENW